MEDLMISVPPKPIQSSLKIPPCNLGELGTFSNNKNKISLIPQTKLNTNPEKSEESVFLEFQKEYSRKLKSEDEFRKVFLECLTKCPPEPKRHWMFGESDGNLSGQDVKLLEKCVKASLEMKSSSS